MWNIEHLPSICRTAIEHPADEHLLYIEKLSKGTQNQILIIMKTPRTKSQESRTYPEPQFKNPELIPKNGENPKANFNNPEKRYGDRNCSHDEADNVGRQ